MEILTAEAVSKVVSSCLFKQDELIDGKPPEDRLVVGDAITVKVGFEKQRLESKRKDVAMLLMELPPEFMATSGGGMSFLSACVDKNGNHWGEHRDMGMLFAIGEASGLCRNLVPRELWSSLPGGMPYYVVDDAVCAVLLQPELVG